jgi:hypothetical protein
MTATFIPVADYVPNYRTVYGLQDRTYQVLLTRIFYELLFPIIICKFKMIEEQNESRQCHINEKTSSAKSFDLAEDSRDRSPNDPLELGTHNPYLLRKRDNSTYKL